MIRAALVRIADRHALYVGLLQEVKHHTQTLRAHADECHVDLVARRDVSRSAQHMTRHDREANRRRGALAQKLAP